MTDDYEGQQCGGLDKKGIWDGSQYESVDGFQIEPQPVRQIPAQ
ncbi:MAG: hypothetical protein VB862_12950 [Pirellulaceae bacterium]